MRRTLQTVAMPVFQFGLFFENDLSFFAEDDFAFGGRVHTNRNLYLAQSDHDTLTLPDRVTAVGEVIRTHLVNGLDGSSNYSGTVKVVRNAPNGFRSLARDEGSLVTNDFAVQNEPLWTALSVGTYSSNIRNGRTGARRLDLPLVAQGAAPVDLIRRPATADENTARPGVYNQRFFGQAAVRILLVGYGGRDPAAADRHAGDINRSRFQATQRKQGIRLRAAPCQRGVAARSDRELRDAG